MAKRTPKAEGRKWYTATMELVAKGPGYPSAQTIEVRTTNKPRVSEYLAGRGYKWSRITITEGRCAGSVHLNVDKEAERYHAELEAMLGKRLPPRYNNGPFTVGYAAAEVMDSDARRRWAEYLEMWSHGLSVSPVPHHLIGDAVDVLYLPARWVQAFEHWDRCTEVVQAALRKRKDHFAHMAEHYKGERSPEARELREGYLTAVKRVDALEGWTFPAFVGRLNLDRSPSPFDVPHHGLLDMATSHMVPTMPPNGEHLKVEWWRQLLAAWDGPANTKAATVEQLLDHHHRHGGRAEVFRALVKSTAKRLHAIKDTGGKGAEHWETLADVLEQWLSMAPKVHAQGKTSTTATARGKRPDLKLVALVHALRYLTGDKSADITRINAQALAVGAGATGKESGRDLLRHYTRYTMGKDHHAQRLDDAESYTVKTRYLAAIAMLVDHQKAKAMAEAELEELRERE